MYIIIINMIIINIDIEYVFLSGGKKTVNSESLQNIRNFLHCAINKNIICQTKSKSYDAFQW